MNESQRTELLDHNVLILVTTQLHDQVDHALVNDLVEQPLVVREERDGQHGVRANRTRIRVVRDLDDKLEQVYFDDLIEHVLVEGDQGGEPGQLLQDVHVQLVLRVRQRSKPVEHLSEVVLVRQLLAMTL